MAATPCFIFHVFMKNIAVRWELAGKGGGGSQQEGDYERHGDDDHIYFETAWHFG